jgi:glycerol-3-phosphate dehydrogenase
MKRDLAGMAKAKYDVLFIGGGVTGASAAYDAAQRGLRVALVEKKDFGWATSAATSKLVHGGLRYLKNLEFGLVRESLRERRVLTQIAPHLVVPTPFLVPTYSGTANNLPMLTAGMVLYELLSFDKGWLEDHARQAPSFRILTKSQVLAAEPGVDPRKLSGGVIYYDCQMRSPERVTLEFVLAAAEHGAAVANYAEVAGVIADKQRVAGARVRDALSGETHELRASVVVNVAGPWADYVSAMALGGEHKKSLIRSQGIHLIFRPVIKDHAVVLRTRGGRHFFLIPWRGMTLAGTTDTRFEGQPDEFEVTSRAVQEFIDEINEVYPSAQLKMADIAWTYGGLRPIVEQETDVEVEVYKASRKYEIYDHAKEDRVDGFVTVIGGKYTTSRHLAEQLVDLIERKLGRAPSYAHTECAPLPGGDFRRWHDFLLEGQRRWPQLSREMVIELSETYGARRDRVVARMEGALAETLHERRALPAATVVQAVEGEMAQTLEDVLWRRTTLGDDGLIGEAGVATAAASAGERLGWSKGEQRKQTKAALDRLERRNIVG